jgi:histidinol-phosphate aminotransferase
MPGSQWKTGILPSTSSAIGWLEERLVPAARRLPAPSAYLAHVDAAAADATLIRLASNENSEPPSPRVRAALEAVYREAHLYPPTVPPLRAALARRLGVAPASVLLGAGSTELIEATLRAFVRAGDEVVVPLPSWPVLRIRLAALDARVVDVPLADEGDSFAYDVDALFAAVTARTKIIVLCSPNNPTGNSLDLDDLRRCADAGPPLLVDAAYADFDEEHDASRLVRESNRIVVTRTFSKAYALAGLRVGYAIGDAELLDYVGRFLVPGSSVSVAALRAALAALEDEGYVRCQIERVRAERERLVPALRALGLRTFASDANFVAVEPSSVGRTPTQLTVALRERGVLIRPMDERLARITVGDAEENATLLAALAAII